MQVAYWENMHPSKQNLKSRMYPDTAWDKDPSQKPFPVFVLSMQKTHEPSVNSWVTSGF